MESRWVGFRPVQPDFRWGKKPGGRSLIPTPRGDQSPRLGVTREQQAPAPDLPPHGR